MNRLQQDFVNTKWKTFHSCTERTLSDDVQFQKHPSSAVQGYQTIMQIQCQGVRRKDLA